MAVQTQKEGTIERVALELTQTIAAKEIGKLHEQAESPREYFFTLYSQCLRLVSGEDPEDVLDV